MKTVNTTNQDSEALEQAKGTKRRKRKEQSRAIETKNAILNAALIEFSNKGFDGASTREIAERADVNHRLIGHHFGNKELLWQATAKQVFGDYVSQQRERYRGLDGVDEPTVLRLMLREFILFSAKTPQLHRFMVQANESGKKRLEWLIKNHLSPGISLDLMLLEKAQKSGMLRSGNLMHLRYLFIGAATSVFTLAEEYEFMAKENPFDEDFVEKHVEMVLSLFLTPKQ
ncbi:TetR/AcrR family transcriptional regulator [Parasphingorhabdus sp.]|uniref:TetR/AcrR family transcriptional regulator n=1 Tax=Parasphingorhabdus sp. TaxID=2709688 RepID=UPI003A914780